MTDNLTDAHLLNALDQIRSMKSERATLRDQFAMAALPALIAKRHPTEHWVEVAEGAYTLADMMLAAREQKK